MRTLWLKIWVWTKAIVAGLLVIYLMVFAAKNSGKPVEFWVWYNVHPEESVLVLSLYAFLGGIVFAVVSVTAFRTIRQVQELSRRNRMERTEKHIAELHAKAASLHAKPAPSEEPLPPIG
jgi:uncharacterized integral membrane protein